MRTATNLRVRRSAKASCDDSSTQILFFYKWQWHCLASSRDKFNHVLQLHAQLRSLQLLQLHVCKEPALSTVNFTVLHAPSMNVIIRRRAHMWSGRLGKCPHLTSHLSSAHYIKTASSQFLDELISRQMRAKILREAWRQLRWSYLWAFMSAPYAIA